MSSDGFIISEVKKIAMLSCLSKSVLFVILLAAAFPAAVSYSQTAIPDSLSQTWTANWIAHPDGPAREFGLFHFRKTFVLTAAPQHFVIHASGDNRYELFVNGQRVLAGPARGDLKHWRYETLDIAPQLQAGKNVLAAVVWSYAEFAPMAQMMN